jgi:hypothetical protein
MAVISSLSDRGGTLLKASKLIDSEPNQSLAGTLPVAGVRANPYCRVHRARSFSSDSLQMNSSALPKQSTCLNSVPGEKRRRRRISRRLDDEPNDIEIGGCSQVDRRRGDLLLFSRLPLARAA